MRKTASSDRVLRREPRFNVGDEHEATVRVVRRAGSYSTECSAELVDISTGGVKLRVPVCLTFEEELRLVIEISSLDLIFDVAAMVRHIRPADSDHWVVGCLMDPPLPDDALSQLAVMSAVERRHWPRRPVTLDVLVRREITGEEFEGIVLNLSTGGIRMLLPKLCEIGEKISIHSVEDGSDEPLAQGSIRWQMDTPDGIAAGFTFTDRESYRVMRNLIDEFEIENPTPLVESLPPRRQVGLVVAVMAMCLPPLLTFALHPYRAGALTEPVSPVETSQSVTQAEDMLTGPATAQIAETTPTTENAADLVAAESNPAEDEDTTATIDQVPSEGTTELIENTLSAESTVPPVEPISESAPAFEVEATMDHVAANSEAAVAEDSAAETPIESSPKPLPRGSTSPFQTFHQGMRVWTDTTGRHTVMAELKSVADGRAKLLKENGRYSTVPLARMSAADNVYIRRWQMFRASEMQIGD